MKDISKIKERLTAEKEDLKAYSGFLYECAGDYMRGWVSALEWVLKDTTSQPANPVDAVDVYNGF
ncbi:MAG: hypothetical protein KKF30_07625 [Proteobacteria bacterium]|nr:hypothetical protein [Pseudomonadota bacterium]MBU4470262.1 hypothetical protein [Pseudomonadota bacterium]MCG2752676.1 hypothetical protein [Desulfobacteraceae bacterium]